MSQRQPQVGETIDDIDYKSLMMTDHGNKGEEVYRCESDTAND